MSPQQAILLRRLITADRESRVPGTYTNRWCEVGSFNAGRSMSTVRALVKAGLVETMSENGFTTLAALRRDFADP